MENGFDIDPMLKWAVKQIGADAELVGVQKVKREGPWLLEIEQRGALIEAVLKAGPSDRRSDFVYEVAAMTLAESHQLPTPRVLAVDLEGAANGSVALLMTRLGGSTDIPQVSSPERLRSLGATAASLHRIPFAPREDLPLRLRHTPWVDFAEERRWAVQYQAADPSEKKRLLNDFLSEHPGWGRDEAQRVLSTTSSTPLMELAAERIRELPRPAGDTVFVHGDLWQGNALWLGDTLVGLIDWEGAGAGHHGVDLGCLRWDATILFGPQAAEEITSGWEEASGFRAGDVAYWDVVAALNTPADMARLIPVFYHHGRHDLDADTLTSRHEDFLRTALGQLDETGGV